MQTIIQIHKTYDDLILLLYDLDKAIEKQYPESEILIKLEVVGGFALMYHGLRIENPISRDIDTLNEISSYIWKLAYDIDQTNWLNDGPNIILHRLYPSIKEHITFIKDTRYRFPNDHLELWIATLDSILGMKLEAMRQKADQGHSKESNPRDQDISDFKEIIKTFNIASIKQFINEYPHFQIYLKEKYIETEKRITADELKKAQTDNSIRKINIFEKFRLFSEV